MNQNEHFIQYRQKSSLNYLRGHFNQDHPTSSKFFSGNRICPVLGHKKPEWFGLDVYIILMAIVSDISFGWQNPAYSSFGNWTIFTYSALLAIGWAGTYIKKKAFGAAFMWVSCAATIAYWLWTNFGTWLVGNMYPRIL